MQLGVARILIVVYLALSAVTLVAEGIVQAAAPSLVTIESWTRTAIVAIFALILLLVVNRAIRGSAGALLRLKIVVPIVFAAFVAVIFLLPLPTWVLIEQIICLVLIAVVGMLIFTARRKRP